MKSKALTELFVNGKFTEDGEKWQHEFQRHCEGVNTDPDETKEVQDGRIEDFFCKGNLHFTVEGRRAEIKIDVVLQARAKMSENEVNGLGDTVVDEMIKQLPLEKIYIITRCFQERFMGLTEAPSSWKIEKLVFSAKTRRGTKERDQKLEDHCADICDVEVVRGVYFSSLEKKT